MSDVDRSQPNWGQLHPLPELEGAITLINQLRAEQRIGDPAWEKARAAAYAKAARILGVKPIRSGKGSSSSWNPTIDALDDYRDDWRGYPFLPMPEALTYVAQKQTLPPGYSAADLGDLAFLRGDRWFVSRDGWAAIDALGRRALAKKVS